MLDAVRIKPITVITISIFSIAIIGGLYILAYYIQSPHLLSKQKALDFAVQNSLCEDNSTSELYNVGIHLLHVKNNTIFSVDEKTMQDMSLAIGYPFKNYQNNEYIWEVTWECNFSTSKENGTQINFVDAITGKLLD